MKIAEMIKKGIKIIFPVSIIILSMILGKYYIIGVIMGMTVMTYILLFPNPKLVFILDKIFGYSDSITVRMKDESQKNEKTRVKVK